MSGGGTIFKRLPWLRRANEGVPLAWGLALIASHLLGVMLIGLLAARYHQSAIVSDRLRAASTLAEQFAGRLVPLMDDETQTGTLQRLARELARSARLRYCAVTRPDGVVVAHSEPGWTGRVWQSANPGAPPPSGKPDIARVRDPQTEASVIEFSVPIVTADTRVAGYVHLGARTLGAGEAKRVLWTWVGCTAALVLGFLCLMYRSMHRALVPLTGVRENLMAFRDNTEQDLQHLRLSSSLGQVASAWNHLVDFTHDLEETVAQLKTRTAVTPLLERYQQQRYRELLDALPSGVMWLDPEDRLVYANGQARQLLGIAEDTPDGTPMTELDLNPGTRDVILSIARSGGDSANVDLSIGDAGAAGQRTVVRLVAAPSHINGAADGTVILLSDVSQQKEAERARDDFLNHVAHELRTPLTNIRAYSETLSHDLVDDPEVQKECFNVINSETQRLSRLIEQILSVSQLEVGTAMVQMAEVRLDKLLRDAVQDVQAEADRKNIDLLLKLPTKIPRVRADRERITVVLINLLGNAIKYTPSGGQVELLCELKDESVELCVSDTGIGIADDQRDRIFEKFYRVEDDYVAEQTGTGLGLAISREIVRLHGGDIVVESQPGAGSQFRLSLVRVVED